MLQKFHANVTMENNMNANELADELDRSRQEPYTSEHIVGKTAAMLRHQADRIAELEKDLH